jgi:hypothetical protein
MAMMFSKLQHMHVNVLSIANDSALKNQKNAAIDCRQYFQAMLGQC